MFSLEFLICALVLLVSFYYYAYYYNKKSTFPPGPTGVPFLGYLPFLTNHPSELGKLARKYGNIFSVTLGSFRVVVLNDFNSIRKAYRQDAFAGRPKSIPAIAITSGGISFNEGVAWNEQRRFTMKALRELGFGRSGLEGSIKEEIQRLIDYLKIQSNKPVCLKNILEISVINTFWSIVASKKYALDDPEAIYMNKICYEGFIEPKIAGPVWFMPWLSNLAPHLTGLNALKIAAQKMEAIFKNLIQERKKTFSIEKRHDFVDIYLHQILSEDNPKSSFYQEAGVHSLAHVLLDLFTAGSDTTSSTLSWTILYLLHYPNVQYKLRAEIEDVVGNDLPSLSDRAKMPYTEATIAEVFRMSSIVSGALLHSTMEDTEFEGYKLPKGTIVMSNLWQVHHDLEHWGDPFNFRPERFLDANGSYRRDDFLIPFGTGKRICPAETLATTNLFLFITSLIHNFDVKAEQDDQLPSLEPKEGLVLATQNYKVILKSRR